MKIIGLSGSSGSGKGYASSVFEELGIPAIDTDRLYREKTVKRGTACLEELTSEFGAEILDGSGELNRAFLARIVFENDKTGEKLKRLNEITHKYIKLDTAMLIEKHRQEGAPAVIIDAPVLYESNFDKMCDFCVCMIAPMDSKIERIIKRDGISREKALARLSTQMSDSELIKRSKYKIDNSGVDIKAQIIEILEKENIIHIKEQ